MHIEIDQSGKIEQFNKDTSVPVDKYNYLNNLENKNKEVKSLKQAKYIHEDIRTDFTKDNKHNNYLKLSDYGDNPTYRREISSGNFGMGQNDSTTTSASGPDAGVAQNIINENSINNQSNLGSGTSDTTENDLSNNDAQNKNKEIKGSQNLEIEPVKITLQPLTNKNGQLFKSFAQKWKTVGWQNLVMHSPIKRAVLQPSGFKADTSVDVPALPSINQESDIMWVKIASIKTLEPQHVYDLSIEGTG